MSLLRTHIDLSALAHNTATIKQLVAPAKLMCVLKADGYNHGALAVAPVMAANGADEFGVATVEEALRLRAGGVQLPITAWIWSTHISADTIEELRAAHIDLAVSSLAHAQTLAGHRLRIYIKVDTGMHRSGVHTADFVQLLQWLQEHPELEVLGLMSHFAAADDLQAATTDEQLAVFEHCINLAREYGFELPCNHIANSAAALEHPQARLDMVRVGIALYGQEPIVQCAHDLRPAMSWRAEVTVIKQIAQGEGTSYGLTWRAPEDGYLAVIPAGYADGVPRSAQDKLTVTIAGHEYPQVGRVCMDQFVVDLGRNPHGVQAGDVATIFGPDGMSAAELARRLGTIDYEVLCLPGGRTQRVYDECHV